MIRKAQRPKNYNRKKKTWPVWVEPKIDGVRALNMTGQLTARSLKKHGNRFVTQQFSHPEYIGCDGELAAGLETDAALCRATASAVGTFEGEPFVLWHLFDYVTEDTVGLPYKLRYQALCAYVAAMQAQGMCGHLRVVPYTECRSDEEVKAAHTKYLLMGYEGSCVYLPEGMHKEGNCSPINGPVWRIKDFIDMEGIVVGITEGDANNNEAQINELGHTFRTSHQENKVPNGMVGSLQCQAIKDVADENDPTVILVRKGQDFTMAPGAMSHDERKHYMANPHLIVGKIAKGKFFPKGIKDAPRFMQYLCLRNIEDL